MCVLIPDCPLVSNRLSSIRDRRLDWLNQFSLGGPFLSFSFSEVIAFEHHNGSTDQLLYSCGKYRMLTTAGFYKNWVLNAVQILFNSRYSLPQNQQVIGGISIQLLDLIGPRKKRKRGKFCDLALAKLISSTFPYKTDIECCQQRAFTLALCCQRQPFTKYKAQS